MNKTSVTLLVPALLAGLLLMAPPGGAKERPSKPPADTSPSGTPTLPPGSLPPAATPGAPIDSGFAKLVDLSLAGQAWAKQDAALLTDVALQLAEGERILQRPHKTVRSGQLLELAVRVAGETKDKDTLERLARVAEKNHDEQLAGQVRAAQKLAGESRRPEPVLSVALDEVKPETVARLQSMVTSIRAARIAGDVNRLNEVDKQLAGASGLDDKMQEQLRKLVGEARSAMPKETDKETAALAAGLDKLQAASRGSGPGWYWGDGQWYYWSSISYPAYIWSYTDQTYYLGNPQGYAVMGPGGYGFYRGGIRVTLYGPY